MNNVSKFLIMGFILISSILVLSYVEGIASQSTPTSSYSTFSSTSSSSYSTFSSTSSTTITTDEDTFDDPSDDDAKIIPDDDSCNTRDDCFIKGWTEPEPYCQESTGDVVNPHLSCSLGECKLFEGFINEDGPYRIDCNYNACYTDDDKNPRCCPFGGCEDEGEGEDKIPPEDDLSDDDLPEDDISPKPEISCTKRQDCLDAEMTDIDDYCDSTNGDVVRPHLDCIAGTCKNLEGTPNEDGPYRLDCNYGACYIDEAALPKCCPEDGCPGIIIPKKPGIDDGKTEEPGIVLPLPEESKSCKSRSDCIDAGWVEPGDYCEEHSGDVVRPHLSCFKGECTILEGEQNKDNAYRVDCNSGSCYVNDVGLPKCCPLNGCPDLSEDDDILFPGIIGSIGDFLSGIFDLFTFWR